MKYRVVIEVGYCDAFYDFDTPDEACNFAMIALSHQSVSEDTTRKKYISISMQIIDPKIKEEVESD